MLRGIGGGRSTLPGAEFDPGRAHVPKLKFLGVTGGSVGQIAQRGSGELTTAPPNPTTVLASSRSHSSSEQTYEAPLSPNEANEGKGQDLLNQRHVDSSLLLFVIALKLRVSSRLVLASE